MQQSEIHQILGQNPWFTELPAQLSETLLDHTSVLPFKQGEILHWQQDDEVEGLYCVLSGAIKVSSSSWQGKEAVLTYLAPSTWFGEIAIFDGLHRTHTAQAHEDSQLLRIPKTELLQIIENNPALYVHVIKLLCEKIRVLMMVLEETALQSLPIRLARRLLMLAQSFGIETEQGVEIALRLPQEELGQMLGVSRQSTNKLLKQLEQKGLITTQYRHIVLTDIAGLKQMLP